MYLSNLKLWNFRKYGSIDNAFDINSPNLAIPLTKGVNVLIGENDSGKTAIIDAIKLILDTHSAEWVKLNSDDFHAGTTRLRIECRFDDLADEEAKHFTEWLGIEGEGEDAKPFLRVILDASIKVDRIIPFDIRAGVDDDGYRLTAEARDYLKTTYLKPLRDAKHELMPRRNSRLSQILLGHEAFKDKDESHFLMKEGYLKFKEAIESYFTEEKDGDSKGKELKKKLDDYLERFFGQKKNTILYPTDKKIKDILEILKLALEDENLGLGSHNLLFIATELLNLERANWTGIRLGLIEELEAHLHPQAQLKFISYLQELTEGDSDVQLIITTHSPNLGSKVKLKNLLICAGANVFPMGYDGDKISYTKLVKDDHKFLERFLDVTKANLFFAKGVILVEGWAEEFLVPAIAKFINCDLTQNGVSVVNIGNTAFMRYSKIFQRAGEELMNIPVAIITDLDVHPDDETIVDEGEEQNRAALAKKTREDDFGGQSVKVFVSPHWTLEYCLGISETLKQLFFNTVTEVHPQIDTDDLLNSVSDKLLKRTLKKAEIAQALSEKLPTSDIDKNSLENDTSVKYIIDAIKYAVGSNGNH